MSRPGPANYTANVNRAKTKKWVEAKSYSYDGDDWGDVDDYDEYGGYDEPEPEPAAKPTGLRQRGQSANQMPQETYEIRQDIYQSPVDSRPQYGNRSGIAPQPQQHYGTRSFTNPQPQNHPAIMRSNSFDREDEQRAFAAGAPQRRSPNEQYIVLPPQAQNVSAHDFQPRQLAQSHPDSTQSAPARPPVTVPHRPSMEGMVEYGEQTRSPGGTYRVGSDIDQIRQANMGSRTQSMTSASSAMDFHNRRDFSPSAMPQPLQTRGSPSPHNPDRNASRPPRKSSLGQGSAPNQPLRINNLTTPVANDQEDDMSDARDRAGIGTGKSLPFVRPADIYRRMQEEREKERQSQESSRPSMDAILGGRNDRPSLGKPQDSESSQRLKPILDPVKERKSEYGLDGVNLQDQETPGERRSTSSKTFEFPKRASDTGSQAPKSSLMPMLPDVSRVSGFGESFFGTTNNPEESSQDLMRDITGSQPPQTAPQSMENPPERSLQHQPSLGFTSAVHQAFDKAEDQVPPTPSSTQGSSVGRSTSGGTSTVSPIISRGPSTATENWNSRLPGIDSVSTPMIPEGPEGSSPRPDSTGSLGTPTGLVRKPSPAEKKPPPETEELPPSFIPGYRRNSDTPSPDNSPRRTPILETNRQLRHPQEVEIAATTPTDQAFSTGSSSQASEIFQGNLDKEQPLSGIPINSNNNSANTQTVPGKSIGNIDMAMSPISPSHDRLRDRTDSSGSSRVRNLADKFESGSQPGSAHSSTPRASVLGGNAQRKDDLVPPRPLADRMESFRPHLPGGWESSASIAPAVISSPPKAAELQHQPEPAIVHDQETSDDAKEVEEDEVASATDQHPSTVTQMKDASEEAFAAVAAAGNALAGAFGSAIGIDNRDSSRESAAQTPSNEQAPQNNKAADLAIRNHGALHPEGSKPPTTAFSDEESSSAAPTPLPKDIPQAMPVQSNESDYFPSISARQSIEGSARPVDGVKPMKQPPALPLLSTNTKPQQYESDRLRKEIVRELTPMSGSEPTTAETDYSNYQQTPSTNASGSRPGRESGVLPKEYESYWNDASSEDGVNDLESPPAPQEDATTAAGIIQPLQPSQGHRHASPLSAPQEISREKSPRLPHRFSWQQPLQNLSPESDTISEQQAAPPSDFFKSAVYPDTYSQIRDGPSEFGPTPPLPPDPDRMTMDAKQMPEKDLPALGSSNLPDLERIETEKDKELPDDPSGLELVSSATRLESNGSVGDDRQGNRDSMGQQRLEPHQHSQQQEPELSQLEPAVQSSSSHIPPQSPNLPEIPQPATAPPKITGFREILALKSPADRIQAYNETREQFANINTGLAHWLAATVNELPEHADLLANSGRVLANVQGHKPSSSRSKLSGLLPSGGQSGQQPYRQQYSNASSQPAASDGNAPGSGIGGGSAQGFSPSGGSGNKLSSQQVQAKGKDLLHTAGVFGGKANVAAKGLFSKGKSKLRAASGNEKAFPRQSSSAEPSSRGIHQPTPKTQAQLYEETFTGFHAVRQDASPEPLYQSHGSQPGPPLGTPSVESFTQSHFGDDERSEVSEPTSREHPPRASSLNPRHGLADPKTSHVVHDPMSVKDHQEGPFLDSFVGSPRDIQTPRSASSSNQTPTQATFNHGNPARPLDIPSPVRKVFVPQENLESIDASDNERQHQVQPSSPPSAPSPHVPYIPNINASKPMNPTTVSTGPTEKASSGNRKSTIRNVIGDGGRDENPEISPRSPSLRNADLDRVSRAPERMNALAASEVSSTVANVQKGGMNRSKSRPVSSSRDSLGVPRPSHDYQMRGPSLDTLPGGIDPDRPPSPVSPYQPQTQADMERRGRTGPIHYGLDHDFVPNGDRGTSRSRSYSKLRSSQGSSIHGHPDPQNGSDIPPLPASSYSGQISRSQSPMLHQQAPEYQIEEASPPLEWPSENRPRSRRGSRSSAFFKSLAIGSSTKTDGSPLPTSRAIQPTSSPVHSPTPAKRNSKRSSIFRSLTGNSGSGSATASAQGKENVNPNPSKSISIQHTQPNVPPPPPRVEDDEFPSRGNSRSAASKISKRLQRASTSGNTEQDGGKKKRFSEIGSLFGRGAPKRQSSSNQSPRGPTRQDSSTRIQERDPNIIVSTSTEQQHWYAPPKDNYTPPPPGGYYAPRPAQVNEAPSMLNQRSQRNEEPSPWLSNTPAYVQDAALRQTYDHQISTPYQPHNTTTPRASATFPQANHRQTSTSVQRPSTTRSSSHEVFPQRPSEKSKGSGSAWARFLQHKRTESQQDHSRTSSHISQQTSPQESTNYPSLPRANPQQKYQQPYHTPSRSDSPPPPPPPPKDEWNHPRARDSTANKSLSQSFKHRQTPSQAFARPSSIQNRQSLPPLQTSVANKRRSTVSTSKTLTPEEKRISRQQELEKDTLIPQNPANTGVNTVPARPEDYEDEPVVMSATSFPGQEWQPDYAHWDGD